jgi:hypothetical protein
MLGILGVIPLTDRFGLIASRPILRLRDNTTLDFVKPGSGLDASGNRPQIGIFSTASVGARQEKSSG